LTAPRLLLIDDDTRLTDMLGDYLRRNGYEVDAAGSLGAGRERLRGAAYDALLLDLMLPDGDGLDLTRELRADARLRRLPLLMLTARGESMDRIVGLELGADDYLPKPFEPRELLARIQTILRRVVPAAANGVRLLRFEGLAIDLDRRTVHRGDAAVELTSTEFELLALLAGAPGKVFSRDDILTRLRGHAAEDIASRAVDILVSRLRRKLEPLDLIRTLRNAGYVFAGVRA
jgi:DNA-binding response OmpR family regulator